MSWIIENWEAIFAVVGLVAAAVVPAAIPYVVVARRTISELVAVIDEEPTPNDEIVRKQWSRAFDGETVKKHAIAVLKKKLGV